jgi:hypothetical protein
MRSYPNIPNIYAETALNLLLKRAKKPEEGLFGKKYPWLWL